MLNFITANNLNGYFFGLTKIFLVLFSFLYLIFALIVVKQVTSMSKSVTDKFNSLLVLFSYCHLGFSVFLILTMLGL